MSMRNVYRQVAKANGISVAEMKKQMQSALDYAYTNADDNSDIKLNQQKISSKNRIPTPDEVIQYAKIKVKNDIAQSR